VSDRPVAFFAMGEEGHFQRLLPLVEMIAGRGVPAYVFTDRKFAAHVQRAGGVFVDLFAAHSLDDADGASRPIPCRFVSFAGLCAEDVLREIDAIRPALVVYDTFAVIGRVAASWLGVPAVNVCAGHNVDPARFLPLLAADPRVDVSDRCHRAVEVLHERYDIEDASPFSYVSGLSLALNVYCEPPEYLTHEERQVFEPVEFFGSLPSLEEMERRRRAHGAPPFGNDARSPKVYVSFGTVVWRYYASEALEALRVICRVLAGMPKARAIVSVGRSDAGAEAVRELGGPNISVSTYVDQWKVLRDADVFVTHHGLNSTHEAIVNEVPMVSYPFFWDQPSLAEKCQRLGVAVALAEAPRAAVTEDHVDAALAEVASTRERMQTRLAAAREWELHVLAQRDAVVRRITDLL
jgi:MGT family glycosyltransferase